MKVLFIITGSLEGTWLSEVTHPYWHLVERGIDVDFSSPNGGNVGWTARSDPYYEKSAEADDLVSKGFLSDDKLKEKLATTQRLRDIDLASYDAVHVAGGRGATFDLYPNDDVAAALEYFWDAGKIVGTICHGGVALGNIPSRMLGLRATAYSLEEDRTLLRLFGPEFVIPHFPQQVVESTGALYSCAAPQTPHVVVDGRLITGQNQQSASEYGIAFYQLMAGKGLLSQVSQ